MRCHLDQTLGQYWLLAWRTVEIPHRHNNESSTRGETTDEVRVDSGVPQGTVLGPMLFLCHINDLPTTLTSQVRLFTDDCLLHREISTFDDHTTLQKDLQNLENLPWDWGMHFNASKCYILSAKKKSNFYYQLDKAILKEVQFNPYLCIG